MVLEGPDIFPPDPHGTAGPGGILQTVNLRIAYFTKGDQVPGGQIIWGPVDFPTFFSSVGGGWYTELSDPQAIYDAASGRFYVIVQDNNSTGSFCDMAVSRTSAPASGGTADWYFYRFDMKRIVNGTTFGGDYPGLAVDSQALFVTYNMFSLPISDSSTANGSQILIFNKAALNNGTATGFTPQYLDYDYYLKPATPRGGNPGNVAYFAETAYWGNPTSVRVWALTDPLGTPTLAAADVTVPNNGGAVNDAPQSGTTATLDTVSAATQGNVFWNNGSIWFCHTAGSSLWHANVYYYRVNLNNFPSGTPTLGESGVIDGGPGTGGSGVWTFQPALGGNPQGDVCLVFSQSSASSFPSIGYTYKRAADAAFAPVQTLITSGTYYNEAGSGRQRWGDFATVSADPVDGTFWISHEYAGPEEWRWRTYWGNILVPGSPGTLDRTFANNDNANSSVVSQAVQSDGNILIGGAFTTFDGWSRAHLARLNTQGDLDFAFNTTLDGNVYAMAVQPDGKIIIGGSFATVNGSSSHRCIARLNSDGSLDSSFAAYFNDYPFALVLQSDGKILAGGQFTTVNGYSVNRLVRLSPNGAIDSSFATSDSPNNRVRSIAVQPDGKIIFAGDFTSVGGYSKGRIARKTSAGSLDLPFGSSVGANSSVYQAIVQSDGKVLIGGGFSSYNGTSRNSVGRLNSDGSLDSSFNPGASVNGPVISLALQSSGKVVIGGSFSAVGGFTRNCIARLTTTGGLDEMIFAAAGFSGGLPASVQTLGLQPNGGLIVGGTFNNFDGRTRRNIARLNIN